MLLSCCVCWLLNLPGYVLDQVLLNTIYCWWRLWPWVSALAPTITYCPRSFYRITTVFPTISDLILSQHSLIVTLRFTLREATFYLNLVLLRPLQRGLLVENNLPRWAPAHPSLLSRIYFFLFAVTVEPEWVRSGYGWWWDFTFGPPGRRSHVPTTTTRAILLKWVIWSMIDSLDFSVDTFLFNQLCRLSRDN